MRADEEQGELSPAAEQLVSLACRELGELPERRRAEGYLELNARRSPPGRRKRFAFGLAAAVVTVALVLIGRRWVVDSPQLAPLSYTLQAARAGAGGSAEADRSAESILRFSDGTKVAFFDGAHGKVKSVDERGARVEVVGKVDVAVVHSPASRWLFDAGPFLITVTGTAFTAEWRAAEARLEVALRAGSISVTGPLADKAIQLRAGQRLLVSTREKEVLIRDLDSAVEPSVGAPATQSPAGPSARPQSFGAPVPSAVPAPAAARASASTDRGASNWTTELAAGHFAEILAQAERRGLDSVLTEASSNDLAALADAARYSRREELARRVLTAQRSRFPRSGRANDATFLLGRLEEAAGRSELALAWYDRCLAESPQGAYVSEAMGRKMTLVDRLHGAARARPIAEEYLRRFANGTYGAAARALTRAP
jgi:hypothetical protein